MNYPPIIAEKNAVEFYKMAYEGNPRKAIELYVGSEYIQHNPDVENGIEGFIEYFERMQVEYPNKSIEFVRVISENDLVALHSHQIWPDNDEYVKQIIDLSSYAGQDIYIGFHHYDAYNSMWGVLLDVISILPYQYVYGEHRSRTASLSSG